MKVRHCLRWAGLLLALTAAAQYTDSVVASINGRVITQFDLRVFTHAELTGGNVSMEELLRTRAVAAERLIDQEVIWSEFQRRQLQVPAALVDKRVDEIVQRANKGDYDAFRQGLAERHLTLDDFRDRIRKKVAVSIYFAKMVDQHVVVSPRQLLDFYREHPELFTVDEQLVLEVITVTPNDRAGRAKLRQLMQDGKDFDAIAAAMDQADNEDLKTPVKHLRQIFRDAFPDGFAVGATSALVTGPEGYWLMRVKDYRPGRHLPFAEVQEEVRDYVEAFERKRRYQEIVERLRADCYIRRFYDASDPFDAKAGGETEG